MIFITFLLILLFNFKSVNSISNVRHCNFSRYMLNYFKLNEHYLLQMYKNFDMYTEEDLKKYGRAFQTHGDVVLFMIEDLHKINEKYVAYDLMTVNLYLNNNSGSINVMYKYQAGNNIDYNKVFLGIQGLKLLNYSMMSILKRFIDTFCDKIPISDFIEYPNEYITQQLNIDVLVDNTKYLREKIIKEIDPDIIEKSNMTIFHPKNQLFYNIMLNQSDKILAIGTELRQHQEFVNGKPKYILDLLRFAPLTLQCADKTDLTVIDVFRFVKYHYLYDDVRTFQKLFLAATFHPVGMLIAYYLQFVCKMIQIGLSPKNYIKNNKLCIYDLGEKIKMILQQFINLKIFFGSANYYLLSIINNLYVILSWVRGMSLKIPDLPNILLNKLELFMNNNLLKFNIELVPNVMEENVMHIHNKIVKKVKQVDTYLQELRKYTNSFEMINVIQFLERIVVSDDKFFLQPNLIDHLCIDNPIDYCKSTNTKCDIKDENNELNVYDVGNNDGLDEFKITNIENFNNAFFNSKKEKSLNPLIDMKDSPKHMVDYFISSE
ncbi:uncharacterized protein LOC126901793 isoform X1 [Daktulosphaira vitifoliae]|uniref:uncharacterized protein LOC126901793 isoform X1 n=1 Tax=Daktulosphaira vitifoliae TaxID=58002 RepID=UPI0021AA4F5D|nr:uncharacterized protein LOC126901793 isoform X1 [Daktulosphaira vitifoliae]